MKLEIESAANFLFDLLRLSSMCSRSSMSSVSSMSSSVISVVQLELFRDTIITQLETHFLNHWFPSQPHRGNGYRCLRINHNQIDPLIMKCGLECGLDHNQLRHVLPNELTLWIDPNEVSYRIGENGSICVIRCESPNNAVEDRMSTTSMTSSSMPSSLSSSPNSSPNLSLSSSPSNQWYNTSTDFDTNTSNSSANKFFLNTLMA